MRIIIFLILFCLYSFNVSSEGYDVFGIGIYDVKFDGSEDNQSTDFRFERRFDNTILDIGPESDNFFF